MEKDINKIIKRLINISQKIIDEFEVLSILSYHDKENTKEFDDHIENVKSFMNSEAVILNNLDLETLYEIYKILPKYDDGEMAYERTHINILDKIDALQYENELDTNILDEIDDEDNPNINDSNEDDNQIDLEKYYLDDIENEKYQSQFMNYINIFVLKTIYDRINNTNANNKNDSKYKKRLLKHLKTFKYLVFAENLEMEKMGINYRFNISKMPYLNAPNIDASIISYNHCISLLEKLYNPLDGDDELDDMMIRLFNMMSFETYLNNVDDDNLDKLLSVCNELKSISKNNYFGETAKNKILKRRKN